MSKKYEYVWALHVAHPSGATATFMLFKTERKAKNGAKEFGPAKGWKTRVEKLVLN